MTFPVTFARPRMISFAAALGLLFAAALHGEIKVLKNFTLIDGTGTARTCGPPR